MPAAQAVDVKAPGSRIIRKLEELRDLTTTVVKQSAQNVTAHMPKMPGSD